VDQRPVKGVRSLKLAQDAVVEIKAGSLYRHQFYTGVPLLFDAGDHATIDAVRITWPNGLIQNEVGRRRIRRIRMRKHSGLSGSCPMIWTWNGREFQFITDVLGVAPLGASDGDGSYFPVDHDEYVQIPGAALSQRHGHYEVRVTEELSEVSYLDQIQLYAVDHPAGTEIFTNEKFKGPPYPEFRLFSVKKPIYPMAARDDQGRDVLPRLISKDQHYPDQFRRSEIGVADSTHAGTGLRDRGPVRQGDPAAERMGRLADGSTFPKSVPGIGGWMTVPYLQVQDAKGRWKTVNKIWACRRKTQDHRAFPWSFCPRAARSGSSPICACIGTKSS
jgi:hypothetical protein